ncbi:MAG TPA: anthranilate phosphoribosyltransferase [Candidatus Baltobacteraceae bacterium]|nr:anthranilate phosphoribosyltransferase [Candidatus Baltobacteraceae bacterium]
MRQVLAGESLSRDEAAAFVGDVMDGAFTPVQAAGLLVALAAKGESVDEIAGAARAMRERSVHVDHGLPRVADVVGTGGDGANTFNISTMAALVVAAAGIPVAKHGNRAASSACGSADVLEAAGLPIAIAPDLAVRMLHETGFTFLFAPAYHPAMRTVAPVRRELGVRTVFNVLGPLTNPAGATLAIVGVARESLLEVLGKVLPALGVPHGAIVHASNGLDEVAGDVPTAIYSFDPSGGRRWQLEPGRFGVDVPLEEIVGGSVERCRQAFFGILGGERCPAAKVVALNAAVVLHAAGVQPRMEDALEQATAILESGAALDTFERAKELASRG